MPCLVYCVLCVVNMYQKTFVVFSAINRYFLGYDYSIFYHIKFAYSVWHITRTSQKKINLGYRPNVFASM